MAVAAVRGELTGKGLERALHDVYYDYRKHADKAWDRERARERYIDDLNDDPVKVAAVLARGLDEDLGGISPGTKS